MTKARSRLNPTATPLVNLVNRESQAEPIQPTQQKKSVNSLNLPSWLTRYKKYWLTLVFGCIGWFGFGLTLVTVSPTTIQHTLIPHVYLPIVTLFGLASFFTLAFILLNTRRAVIITLCLVTLFTAKLQQFVFTLELVSLLVIFFGILELSLTLLTIGWAAHANQPPTRRANIKSQTHHPQRN
jgi:hypothetical protein